MVQQPFWQKFLMRLQSLAMKLSRGLFAYQMLMVVRPLPTVDTLLADTHRHSAEKSSALPELAGPV